MISDQTKTYKVSSDVCLVDCLIDKPKLYNIIREKGYELLEGKAKKGRDLLEVMNYIFDHTYSDREF